MRSKSTLISFVLCSFAIASVAVPLYNVAEASTFFSTAKSGTNHAGSSSLKIANNDDGCTKKGEKNYGECKPDSAKQSKKSNYIDPDRKGHKVKKSKSRR